MHPQGLKILQKIVLELLKQNAPTVTPHFEQSNELLGIE